MTACIGRYTGMHRYDGMHDCGELFHPTSYNGGGILLGFAPGFIDSLETMDRHDCVCLTTTNPQPCQRRNLVDLKGSLYHHSHTNWSPKLSITWQSPNCSRRFCLCRFAQVDFIEIILVLLLFLECTCLSGKLSRSPQLFIF